MPAASPAAGPADGGGLAKPRRGRQFSLRTAFVMLTLAAVVFGVLSPPLVRWRGHANLLFANWLNYYVYQTTPYDHHQIPDGGTYAYF